MSRPMAARRMGHRGTHKKRAAERRSFGSLHMDLQSGNIVVDLISSIDKSAVTLCTRTSEISA